MSESTKQSFNDTLRGKMAGKAAEQKATPEQLLERANVALEELQSVLAELAVTPAPEGKEEEKTK